MPAFLAASTIVWSLAVTPVDRPNAPPVFVGEPTSRALCDKSRRLNQGTRFRGAYQMDCVQFATPQPVVRAYPPGYYNYGPQYYGRPQAFRDYPSFEYHGPVSAGTNGFMRAMPQIALPRAQQPYNCRMPNGQWGYC